jgi:hypothetical protein
MARPAPPCGLEWSLSPVRNSLASLEMGYLDGSGFVPDMCTRIVNPPIPYTVGLCIWT